MKKKSVLLVVSVLLIAMFTLAGCSPKDDGLLDSYTIPQIDLDATAMPVEIADIYKDLYGYNVVDDGGESINYLAHPDAVMLDGENEGKMVIYYSKGHGRGAIGGKVSSDNGKTWEEIKGLPISWQNSMETPTIYKLQMNRGTDNEKSKYVLISGCPTWGGKYKGNGFNVSLSDDGITGWTEFQNFYGLDYNGKKGDNFVASIVAMASLTQLKDENGNWTNSWMGFFHDDNAYNYKSILTFDDYGYMQWSTPEKYFANYRSIEKKAFMCEVEVVRSDAGEGNELMLLARSNGRNRNKEMNSLMSISKDEGKTWSEPKQLPAAVNGERHKAEWIKDKDGNDRLFITFRSISKDSKNFGIVDETNGTGNGKWYSEGWIAWVGTFDDLKECKEGQYRIKLAHTYLENQTKSVLAANGDCGYSGNVVFDGGYKIMTSTYGMFSAKRDKTIIASKVVDIR
ncbi:MAG: glycoside hydrolase, partial [Clostridia bacterium]|nr:glycoside hydrolase [Clostridia bacterium]